MTQKTSARPLITASPKWEPRMGRRDATVCSSDTNGRLSCGISTPSIVKKGVSPAPNIAPLRFINTTASFTTSSGSKAVTLVTPQTSSDTAEASVLSITTNPSATRQIPITSGPFSTTTGSITTLSWTGNPSLTTCTSLNVSFDAACYASSTGTLVDGPFPTNSTTPSPGPAPTGTGLTPSNIFPIVIPSAFIIICVLIFSVVGNRRKWAARAYQHLSRERQMRRRGAPLDAAEANDDAIPLRDLETPPPAYSPYNFSFADREFLGLDVSVAYPMGTPHEIGSESNMIGRAYPLGDSGRHGSG